MTQWLHEPLPEHCEALPGGGGPPRLHRPTRRRADGRPAPPAGVSGMEDGTREETPSLYEVPTLADGEVVLRAAQAGHARRLAELMRDVDTQVLTGAVHSAAHARRIAAGEEDPWESLEWLEEVYDRWAVAEDRAVWVIEVEGEIVGEIALMDLDPFNRSCGLRVWITGARDEGIGTRASLLAMEHAFDGVGLHRVSLEVYDHNPRARHLYEKLGFVHEGTARDAYLLDGEWIDRHDMAMLAPEWESRR